MGYIGNQTSNSYSSLDKQTITGDGGTGYTLDHAVANAQEIEVFVNNVRQEPGVAYTVSGTTLTMTGNVAAADSFYVVFQGKALQSVVPPDDSVTTARINDGAVTTAKIADDAVDGSKLSNDITIAGDLTVSGDADTSKMAGSDVTLNTKTSHTFTNIPSVYNRLTLFFNGVSMSADGEVRVQFGTSSGIVTTGYWNRDAYMENTGTLQTLLDTNNNCFTLASWTGNSNGFYGYYQFHHIGNTWFSRINGSMRSNNNNYFIEQFGQIDLSGPLTQIKVLAAAGTFDAGTINLLYG